MLIIILCIVLFVAGFFLNKQDDFREFIGVSLCLFSGFTFALCLFAILCVQVNREVGYQNKLYEREMLEYRLEKTNEDIVGNEMLYNDIVEFNNSLRSTKKWANNPWTNWFNNADIATIDYIEVE